MIKEIPISTHHREEFLDITSGIEDIVSRERVKEGICSIFCPHTTCALTINENADPAVKEDILNALGKVVPDNLHYSHLEGNAPAHIKSSLLGNSLTIFIEKGHLKLGTWQGIFLCEFDGPRTRKVYIKIIAG